MITAAAQSDKLTTAEQLAFVCMVVGACVIFYVLARGAAYVLLVLVIVVWVISREAWRAHKRGMARVHAYTATEAERASGGSLRVLPEGG